MKGGGETSSAALILASSCSFSSFSFRFFSSSSLARFRLSSASFAYETRERK
jgi:hypothetical protein